MDSQHESSQPEGHCQPDVDPLINPCRTPALFAHTAEGLIIAEDIGCQYEYARDHASCPHCTGHLRVMAQINHAGRGISEMVCLCLDCQVESTLLFDVSNDGYQAWLATMLNDLYVNNYDGPPRRPATI